MQSYFSPEFYDRISFPAHISAKDIKSDHISWKLQDKIASFAIAKHCKVLQPQICFEIKGLDTVNILCLSKELAKVVMKKTH